MRLPYTELNQLAPKDFLKYLVDFDNVKHVNSSNYEIKCSCSENYIA